MTITALAASFSAPAVAMATPVAMSPTAAGDSDEDASLPYLQCVPYAREVSGIKLFGDAHTWWDQAEGKYARGNRPRVGAVMSFHPHGAMTLGHVAAVSRVIDSRTVLLRHANWSLINGRRGQVEDNVRAIDVSPANDWSEVRVWFAPLGDLGTTHWPVDGFIYNKPASRTEAPLLLAANTTRPAPVALTRPVARARVDSDFLKGVTIEPAVRRPMTRNLAYTAPVKATTTTAAVKFDRSLRNDPIGRIIASRMK